MKKTALLLIASILFGLQLGFANAAYYIHQDNALLTIQSPAPNASFEETCIPLIVDVSLIYGTTTILDEFSLENLTCSYSLDNGEWREITSINAKSNISQPDIDYWNGLLHKLNLTCSTTLQGLTDGVHSVNITLTIVDSSGTHQSTSQANFNINLLPEPPQNQSLSPQSSSLAPQLQWLLWLVWGC